MGFKENLYARYYSTHLLTRKGVIDLQYIKHAFYGYHQHYKKLLPTERDSRIADLGCGNGLLVAWLNQLGYTNVTGADISSEQIDIGLGLGVDNIYNLDVFELLKQNEAYNLLISRDLLEHFDRQQAYRFLSSCFSSLKTQGRLILQVPNANSPFFGRVLYGDATHEQAFTASSITQILSSVGYTNIKVFPWRPVISGLKSILRYLIWRALELIIYLPIVIETSRPSSPVTMNIIIVAHKP